MKAVDISKFEKVHDRKMFQRVSELDALLKINTKHTVNPVFRIGSPVVAMHHQTRYWGYVRKVSPDHRVITIEYYSDVGKGYKQKQFYSNEVVKITERDFCLQTHDALMEWILEVHKGMFRQDVEDTEEVRQLKESLC